MPHSTQEQPHQSKPPIRLLMQPGDHGPRCPTECPIRALCTDNQSQVRKRLRTCQHLRPTKKEPKPSKGKRPGLSASMKDAGEGLSVYHGLNSDVWLVSASSLRLRTPTRQYAGFSSIPTNRLPAFSEPTPSEAMPPNGDNTTSPGLL